MTDMPTEKNTEELISDQRTSNSASQSSHGGCFKMLWYANNDQYGSLISHLFPSYFLKVTFLNTVCIPVGAGQLPDSSAPLTNLLPINTVLSPSFPLLQKQ